jgi:hypothetical protein
MFGLIVYTLLTSMFSVPQCKSHCISFLYVRPLLNKKMESIKLLTKHDCKVNIQVKKAQSYDKLDL